MALRVPPGDKRLIARSPLLRADAENVTEKCKTCNFAGENNWKFDDQLHLARVPGARPPDSRWPECWPMCLLAPQPQFGRHWVHISSGCPRWSRLLPWQWAGTRLPGRSRRTARTICNQSICHETINVWSDKCVELRTLVTFVKIATVADKKPTRFWPICSHKLITSFRRINTVRNIAMQSCT